MLAALIGTVPPDRRSFHSYGPSDASGFAAMGEACGLLDGLRQDEGSCRMDGWTAGGGVGADLDGDHCPVE